MQFLRLFERFILRALVREKVRSGVAALGIALGVAVFTAVRLANQSVGETFAAAVSSVSGQASVRIRGVSGRFDEQLLKRMDWLGQYGSLSPVIESMAMVVPQTREIVPGKGLVRGELLQVMGVDVLLDSPLREYRVLRLTGGDLGQTPQEILSLLTEPDSIILTEKFLRRHRMRVGERIPLVFNSRQRMFVIRGVLLDRGPARALDGNFALMDIASAQLASDRLGYLDYLDVMLRSGRDPDAAIREIQQRLPPGVTAESPQAAYGRGQTMIAAFQFNLEALSCVSILVGIFLIYGSVSITVAARTPEIGILQAVGAGRRLVLGLFLAEAIGLAVLGIVFGLPLGRYLATYAVKATAQTVETFYIASVADSAASALRMSWADILLATFLALSAAVLAALLPAWEGACASPVDSMRGHVAKTGGARIVRQLSIAAVCFALGLLLARLEPVGGKPLWGFLSALAFVLSGAWCATALLWVICRGAQSATAARIPYVGLPLRLAASNLLASIRRVAVSVGALGVALGMMVALAVMVGSFRQTVVYWLDNVLSADLAVRPVMQSSSLSNSRLSDASLRILRHDPDVVETVVFSSEQVPFESANIRLAVTELSKSLKHGRILFKAAPDHTLTPSLLRDEVLVSESFSLRFRKRIGDFLEMPAAGGAARLRIAAIYYDYSSNQGTILMDNSAFQRHVARSQAVPPAQSLSIYLRPGASVSEVRRRLVDQLGPDEQVYCVTSSEVRREAMRIFDSTFAITYALLAVAILVAGLGVSSTLITLIYQRQRDVGLLALVGATGRQVRRIILMEAVMVGGASQLLGVATGLVLAMVLIYVINVQSFAWTIQVHLPVAFLVQSTVFILVGSALFGLYPAVRAARVDPLQSVREE
jgi:putative ABC transport system permease protein